jgi:hypothetical protein
MPPGSGPPNSQLLAEEHPGVWPHAQSSALVIHDHIRFAERNEWKLKTAVRLFVPHEACKSVARHGPRTACCLDVAGGRETDDQRAQCKRALEESNSSETDDWGCEERSCAKPTPRPTLSVRHASRNASIRRRNIRKARDLTLQPGLNRYMARGESEKRP